MDNPDQIKSLKTLIGKTEPDIICLQEVTPQTVEFIKLLSNYYCSRCVDFARPLNNSSNIKQEIYLVILSKFQIQNSFFGLNAPYNPNSLLAKFKGINQPREFQYVDIIDSNNKYSNNKFRIFNLHLEMATGSKRRLQEFGNILAHKNIDSTNLFCGDFNIFSRPMLNFLIGWGLGLSAKEYFMDERLQFNKLFATHNLDNIFSRKITYPKFRLQLDHILVPKNLQYQDKYVLSSCGSDHRPIMVEL